MNSPSRDKPLLVYDGDCSFCKIWIEYWKTLTVDLVSYAPFQEVAGGFPNIPPEKFWPLLQQSAAAIVKGYWIAAFSIICMGPANSGIPPPVLSIA
jgi:hypothetical protein